MAASHILVVDDEKDVAKVVVARLQKHGFSASAVNSGKEALEYVKARQPDLIILDLFMPEMDGYEVAQRLRSEKATENIAIIMLTVEVSQKDKIKALKMGIDDYITKPFDADELIARVEVILRRSETACIVKEAKGISLDEEKELSFLKYLLDNQITRIEPEYNMLSKNGYTYKVAADFFKTEPGLELEDLKDFADKQIFRKEFFDKILVCPYCSHHDINLRETSPSDHSPDIALAEVLHHYSCGYVGTEEEFLQGIQYVCPKCHKELRNIGVDYDKPGSLYVSNKTKEKFKEPDIYCQCRNCKKLFEADDAVRQEIYAFVVTNKAKTAVSQGRLSEINLEQELIDLDINVYNLHYFKTKFSEEIKRCQTFKRPLSLILVTAVNFDEVMASKGEVAAKRLLKDLTLALRENLWSVDIPARYEKNSFITLLLEADKKRAEKIVAMLKEKTRSSAESGLRIDIKMASFPEDAKTEEELLEKLIQNKPV